MGKMLLGVLACPNLPADLRQPGKSPAGGLGQIYAAARGRGAERIELGTLDALGARTSIHVSGIADPALARWCERVESSDRNHDLTAQVVQRVGIRAEPDRLDSQAKYAVVARGE